MSRITVGAVSKLPPGSLVQVEVNGREYAVCNAGGKVHVLDGTCPHAGGPIGHGALHGNMIVCPWHAWEFDCRTGENDYDAAIRVETYAVHIEGDEIQIETDPSAGTS